MKRFGWRWLALSSVMVAMLAANAETRPQYGGIVHVAMRAAPTSLDPTDRAQPDSFAERSLILLIFDTLVSTDENGHTQAGLATSWQAVAGNRWQFRIRREVKFHDGSPLTAEIAAASIRVANPSWNVQADGESVVIEAGDPELLAELALSRNAIVKRNAGTLSGTGPFRIVDWQAGKKLTLAAEEGCWRGRPFLDRIELEMGRSFRDQMTSLELGKADLVEIAPEQSHRVSLEGRRLATSLPVELWALMFTRDANSPDDKLLREALALSVERGSIRSVLLQGAGQPAASVLPNWMSGYGFVFSTDADLPRARHEREQVRVIPNWTVAYDSGDPLARLLTERLALNARDAGLTLQPSSQGTTAATDLRLVRIQIDSIDPWIALANIATTAGLPPAKNSGGPVEELYTAEQSILATQRLIPLFHLPISYAAAPILKNWTLRPDGSWSLADAWLESAKP